VIAPDITWAVASVIFLITGVSIILGWSLMAKEERRDTRYLLAVAILTLSVAAVTATAQWYTWDREFHNVVFTYEVVFEPNGTGRARIALPMPTEESLLADLTISPASASVTVSRSGLEPALDVEFSERTTLRASFSGYRASFAPDLSQTSDTRCAPDSCSSTLVMTGVQGNVSEVHVHLSAVWSSTCVGQSWLLDAYVGVGSRSYPGSWQTVAC